MDLSQLIERAHKKTAWVEICGFEVELRYPTKRDLREIEEFFALRVTDDGTELVPDRARRARFLARFVKDWRGLSPQIAGELLGIEIDAEQEIPCTAKNKVTLVENAPDFEAALQTKLSELYRERVRKAEEAQKN